MKIAGCSAYHSRDLETFVCGDDCVCVCVYVSICACVHAYVEIKKQPQASVLIFHMAWEWITFLHHGSWPMSVQELSCPATSLPERDWDCRLELTVTPSILRLHTEPPSQALQWGIFLYFDFMFLSQQFFSYQFLDRTLEKRYGLFFCHPSPPQPQLRSCAALLVYTIMFFLFPPLHTQQLVYIQALHFLFFF